MDRRPTTTGRPVSTGGRPIVGPEGSRSTHIVHQREGIRESTTTDPSSYYDGRCIASYKDGRKCMNKAVNNHNRCLGHLRTE